MAVVLLAGAILAGSIRLSPTNQIDVQPSDCPARTSASCQPWRNGRAGI